MFDLLRPYRPLLGFAALFSLFLNLSLLAPSLYMLQVYDRVFTSRSNDTLLWLTLVTVVALLLYLCLDWVRSRLLLTMSRLFDRLVGERVLREVVQRGEGTSGRESFALRDVAVMRNFLAGQGIQSLFDAPWVPVFVVINFLFHPLLGAISLAGALLLFLVTWCNDRISRQGIEAAQDAARQSGRYAEFAVRHGEVVRALGMVDAIARRWSEGNQRTLALQSRSHSVTAWLAGTSRFMRQMLQVVMMAVGAYLVIDQHVTPGIMLAVTTILGRALAPVEGLLGSWKMLAESRAAWRRLDQLLKEQDKRPDRTTLPAPTGQLSTERVVFGLKPGAPAILKGVSFDLPAGEMLGLIGPSGSGKSTLAKLLVGIQRPTSGSIRIDGADLTQWPSDAIGPYLGYLPQDVELFPGTVAENIARLGIPDDRDVIRAAQQAHAHEMILRLPEGYDTQLGPEGIGLSGGQRQRIGLARALYGSPRLVVLDEPNAALDSEGEQALVTTLRELKEHGVTLVVITHKPALLAGADKLMVLQEGQLLRFGPRERVLAELNQAVIGNKGATHA